MGAILDAQNVIFVYFKVQYRSGLITMRQFSLHKPKQKFDLLHLCVQLLTKLTFPYAQFRPQKWTTFMSNITCHHLWHEVYRSVLGSAPYTAGHFRSVLRRARNADCSRICSYPYVNGPLNPKTNTTGYLLGNVLTHKMIATQGHGCNQ